jgi:stage V sporulation protein S
MDVLKVSSRSVPSSVAGAMAGVVRQHGAVEVQVVGAGALNQAVKAVAIARGYLAPSGMDVVCIPTFVDVEIDGQSRTAMRLLIEDRNGAHAAPVPVPGPVTVDLRDGKPADGQLEAVAPVDATTPLDVPAPVPVTDGAPA